MASAELRARLQEAARRLFSERPFEDVSVRDICAAAGSSPATFYRYFGSKEAVLFDDDALIGGLRAAIRQATDDGVVDLRDVISNFSRFLDAREGFGARTAIAHDNERLRAAFLLLQHGWRTEVTEALAGDDEPDLRSQVGGALAIAVVSAAIRQWSTDPSRPLPNVAGEAADLIVAMLA